MGRFVLYKENHQLGWWVKNFRHDFRKKMVFSPFAKKSRVHVQHHAKFTPFEAKRFRLKPQPIRRFHLSI